MEPSEAFVRDSMQRWVTPATLVVVLALAVGFAAGSSSCPCREPTAAEKIGAPYGGVPVPRDSGVAIKILENPGFQNGYSFDKQGPLWTSYYVFPCQTRSETASRPDWSSDPEVGRQVAETAYDCTLTRYERGHMAPKYAIETRYGEEAMLETFRMSNAWPQRGDLNSGPWERLEWLVAEAPDCYADTLGGVWVIAGPVFDKYLEQLPSGFEIPDAFFEIMIDELDDGSIRVLAFVMPREASGNAPDDSIEVKNLLRPYLASIDEIQDATGLDFLPGLPAELQTSIEQTRPQVLW